MRDYTMSDIVLLGCPPRFGISRVPRPFDRDWTILGHARGLSGNRLAVPFLFPSSLLDRVCRSRALVGLEEASGLSFENQSLGSELLKETKVLLVNKPRRLAKDSLILSETKGVGALEFVCLDSAVRTLW